MFVSLSLSCFVSEEHGSVKPVPEISLREAERLQQHQEEPVWAASSNEAVRIFLDYSKGFQRKITLCLFGSLQDTHSLNT